MEDKEDKRTVRCIAIREKGVLISQLILLLLATNLEVDATTEADLVDQAALVGGALELEDDL